MTVAAALTCSAAVAGALLLRLVFLLQPDRVNVALPPAFLAAEGVVGLMARHIVCGARPLFYYGQFYLGAFEAYVAAIFFMLLGETLTVLRLVPVLFALLWIPLGAMIAARLFGPAAGFLAAALIALPSPFVFQWGFIAWGGHSHGATVLAALLVLIVFLERASHLRIAVTGFVTGFSIWVNQLALGYVPVVAYALLRWRRWTRGEIVALFVAGALGLGPLLYGNVVHPLATARHLAARVVSSWQLSARLTSESFHEARRFHESVPFFQLLGAQPQRDGRYSVAGIAVSLLFVTGLLWAIRVAVQMRRHDLHRARRLTLALGFAAVAFGAGISGFFGQPVGRYQLPLYAMLAIFTAGWLVHGIPRWAPILVAFTAGAQAYQILGPVPDDGRTATVHVVEKLLATGLSRGYGADYFYEIVFLSSERILIEPVGWSKYPLYEAQVAAAARPFYLYRDDQEQKLTHRAFMDSLSRSGTKYSRLDISEYHVLYDFSPPLARNFVVKVRDEIRRAQSAE